MSALTASAVDREIRRQHRLAVAAGIQFVMDESASEIRRPALAGAVSMVRESRPVLRRVREETGFSLAQIMERAPNMKEASLMAGCGYHTVRRYSARWGVRDE